MLKTSNSTGLLSPAAPEKKAHAYMSLDAFRRFEQHVQRRFQLEAMDPSWPHAKFIERAATEQTIRVILAMLRPEE